MGNPSRLDKAYSKGGGRDGTTPQTHGSKGWKKGEGHYSGGMDDTPLMRATDYTKRGISPVSFGEPMKAGDRARLGAGLNTWAPGKIKQGSSMPRYGPKFDFGTSPSIQRAKQSGKFANRGKGGKGKGDWE